MKRIEVNVANPDLEALDAYLSSERSPEDSMLLSDLDGFLTAIAVGPEPIAPEEWMPLIWGGEEPVFADQAEAKAVLGAVAGRFSQILRHLDSDSPDPDPIFWTNDRGDPVAGDWAEGFLDAMRLRFEAWQPLFDDQEASDALLPILGLCSDESGESLLGFDEKTDDKLAADAPDVIPGCILLIDAFWKARRQVRAS